MMTRESFPVLTSGGPMSSAAWMALASWQKREQECRWCRLCC
jgi:hypothetical protein